MKENTTHNIYEKEIKKIVNCIKLQQIDAFAIAIAIATATAIAIV